MRLTVLGSGDAFGSGGRLQPAFHVEHDGQRLLLDCGTTSLIGMRRRGFTASRLKIVREFYQQLFHGGGIFAERLAAARAMENEDPAIAEILKFIVDGKKRPLCMAHNNPDKPSERAHREV